MKSNLVIRHRTSILILGFALAIAGCSGAKRSVVEANTDKLATTTTQENDSLKQLALDANAQIANATRTPTTSIAEIRGCQVKATIIEIDPALDTLRPDGPCGKVPCHALIRIDQVVKMGQLCAPFVVVGAEMKAYFRFSLSKTDSLFPNMKRHFPGLEKNDTFAASFVAYQDKNGVNQVAINNYTKSE